MEDMTKKWNGFYQPLERLLVKAGEDSRDKKAAKVARDVIDYLFSAEGRSYLDGTTLHILSVYDNRLTSGVVLGKLELATDEEKIVLFSKGKVSSRVARRRLPSATPIERGLIAAIIQGCLENRLSFLHSSCLGVYMKHDKVKIFF